VLITENRRSQLLARVLRKEHLARMCEQGKIAPEEYLEAINAIRADEQLPPLTLADASCLPARTGRPRRSRRKPA
jgi:hypothetical protein